MTQIYHPSQNESSKQWSWITLIGPDVKDFLHRLTTVNLKFLGVGQGRPGFFLTAQGKIRSYFHLWNFGPQEYAFEFNAGASGHWKKELLTAIDQFTFSEKMTLTDVTELQCCWLFPESDELEKISAGGLQGGQTLAIDEEIRICHHGDTDYGRTWITAWGKPARLNQWLDHFFSEATPISLQELESRRIQAVRPQVDSEITETVLPLEVGLRDAIAENKGCYPGQEVIERIVALGSPPRRLVKIEGPGRCPQPGDPVLNLAEPPTEVGTITSAVQVGERYSALGLIKKIHAKEELPVRFSRPHISEGVIVKIAPYA
jgi:folate-binding protein YgfZ